MHSYCPKCHYPKSHPFGLNFSNGECSGCFTHKEKDLINWEEKLGQLKVEIKRHTTKHAKYDCIVPVVGDAEDYYTLSKVLELNLSPLVVCVNDYFKNDIGWHNLHQLITHFDVDSFVFNPDIRVYKDLIKTSLRKYDHILLPFLQLHTSFPIHVAYERKIPLIIWGQNQSVEQVGKFSHYDNVEMSKWSRKEHDLFNVDTKKLIGNGAQVNLRDLNYYNYPDISNLNRRGVKGLYLSNYMRWDPLIQNKSAVEYGFHPEVNNASFDIYERAGSSVYYGLHDLLKYKRVGYRKVNDHVAREIRHGRLSSEEGMLINQHYSKEKVHIKPFFDWLGASKSGYEWFKLHRLDGLDYLISDNEVESSRLILPESIKSLLSSANKPKKQHMLFGKGI